MNKLIVFLAVSILLFACADKREKRIEAINLKKSTVDLRNQEDMKALADLQVNFYKDFKDDSLSDEYLFEAAMHRKNFDNNKDGLKEHFEVYPNSKFRGQVLYALSDWHNKNDNIDKAIEYYELFSDSAELSQAEWKEMFQLYDKKASVTTDDSKAKWMVKSGNALMAMNEAKRASEKFEFVATNYANFERMDEVLFRLGFVHWNYLKDGKSSEKWFKKLVAQFPKSDLSKDASSILENRLMYLSDDEFMDFIRKKNASNESGVN